MSIKACIIIALMAVGLWSLLDYALFAWRMRNFAVAVITFSLLLTAILGVVLCK